MNQLLAFAVLAICGGIFLGVNRALLGQLGGKVGASGASAVNHIVGVLFLIPLVLWAAGTSILQLSSATPWYAYLGGIIGALFSALTSFLIPRLGVMKTTVMFISGQMLGSTVIDYLQQHLHSPVRAAFGVALIVTGIILGEYHKFKAPPARSVDHPSA